ncbi:hypothetical protein F4825DRAFT_475153 [Nemania diffusa]|nr:hypothetical protein F4825DRAFT_475153 [Nemania diffusa]
MPCNENASATGSLLAPGQDPINTITTLPPIIAQDPMSTPIAEANAINASILAIRGLSTTATNDTLYMLANDALDNEEIDITSQHVSSNITAPVTTQGVSEGGAVDATNHENGKNEISNPRNESNEGSETPVVTFEPFYFFFYGSLQVPNVLRRVIRMWNDEATNPLPLLTNASIKGWKIKMWGPYPALVPATAADGEEGLVQGAAWLCDKPEYVPRLCTYESAAYRMAYCDISIPAADGNGVQILKNARTFVTDLSDDELEDGGFDLDLFQKSSLA